MARRTLLCLLLVGSVGGQTQDQSPAELIRYLTYQSGREPGYLQKYGVFTCGSFLTEVREDQKASDSLVKLGPSAIPELEGALDSIEKQGEDSLFAIKAGSLLHAYAKIEGTAALPRIRRMAGNPKVHLAVQQISLDQSFAVALGLTSYVSGSREILAGRNITCGRVLGPQYFLDQLILGWERNDRPSVEAYLGPNARAALKLLLNGRSWAAMRANFWHGKSGSGLAVGYKLENSGKWWPEFERALEDQDEQPVGRTRIPENFELDALLKDSSGGDCGRRSVKFLRTHGESIFDEKFVIDNSDLGDLLGSFSSCATAATKKP